MLVTPAEATYLVWINYEKLNIPEQIFIKEISKRLLVSAGSKFGKNAHKYIRLNIACPFEKVEKAMYILKDVITKFSEL